MARKKESQTVADLKKYVESKKAILGTQRTMKQLKAGALAKVFVSANIPQEVKEDIAHYSKLYNVELVELDKPNTDVGVMCKKQFPISVLSVLKE